MQSDYKIIEHFLVTITEANQSYTDEFTINDTSQNVTGIQLSSDREDLLHARGSVKIDLSGNELFGEGHEAKMLMASIHVNPNKRMYEVDEKIGNGKIKIQYSDKNHPRTTFTPYQVILYVESIIPSENA